LLFFFYLYLYIYSILYSTGISGILVPLIFVGRGLYLFTHLEVGLYMSRFVYVSRFGIDHADVDSEKQWVLPIRRLDGFLCGSCGCGCYWWVLGG